MVSRFRSITARMGGYSNQGRGRCDMRIATTQGRVTSVALVKGA
jgi:hypothetical protein